MEKATEPPRDLVQYLKGTRGGDALDPKDIAAYIPRLLRDWPEGPGPVGRELEGTLVFADLSGFTALSERLAVRGKEGAEILTELIDATFAKLLEPAYEAGGSLLKMGGDALLLFFTGSAHPERGCYAAATMRRRLRETGALPSPAGPVTLRMSTGVHSGPVLFVVAGSSHRELVLAGPAVSRVVEMESAADAGQVVVSPETAGEIGSRWTGDAKGPGLLLKRTPPAPSEPYPLSSPSGSGDLPSFLPSALRRHLSEGGGDPEHRIATVCFVRVEGTDSLVAAGADAATATVGGLIAAVQEAADAHQVTFLGTDVDKDAFKVILCTGVPDASEDDAGRLLRAATAISNIDAPLPLKIGLNAGRLFSGSVGPAYRRTYTVMGDVVNTAARVMSASDKRKVLATEAVLHEARELFETEPLPPFAVKGRKEPVVAHRVERPTGTLRSYGSGRTPLVGRDAELASLLRTISEAAAGRQSTAVVVGDAGIGKSRLLEEVRSRSSDVTWLEIRCDRYTADTAYFAVRLLLRRLLGVSADDGAAQVGRRLRDLVRSVAPRLEPWIPLLAIPADAQVPSTNESERLDPSVRRSRIQEVTADLLRYLLPGAAVILFEDAHWMDEASAALLEKIASTGSSPWALLISRRPVDTGFAPAGDRVLTLDLAALSAQASARLVREVADRALLPQEAEMLAERSGGNPLLAAELAHAFSAGASDLPSEAETLIAARLDRLPPADRTRLRYLAVLGSVVPRSMLDTLAMDVPELDLGAARSLRDIVEVSRDLIRFKHALFHTVAYEGLPFRRRRELHGRVAEALERGADDPTERAEILSLHYHSAGRANQAWRYSRLAAERAREKSALAEAATFYRRALEVARRAEAPSNEIQEAWASLGLTLFEAGSVQEALHAYRQARTRAKDSADLARLMLREGVARARLGNYPGAVRWYKRGLQLVSGPAAGADGLGDVSFSSGLAWYPYREARVQGVRLRVSLSEIRQRQGRYKECIRLCREALAEAEAIGDVGGIGHAYSYLHAASVALRDEARKEYGRRALETYERVDDPRSEVLLASVLNNMAMDAYHDGEWSEARDLYGRAQKSLLRVGRAVEAAVVTMNIAEIVSDQGRPGEALPLFEEAMETFEAAGATLHRLVVLANIGRAMGRLGRCERAAATLDQACEGFGGLGARAFRADAIIRRAAVHVLCDEPREALDALERAASTANPSLRPALERIRGIALTQSGELAEARDTLLKALDEAESAGSAFEQALTLIALAGWAEAAGEDPGLYRQQAAPILARLGIEEVLDMPRRADAP